VHSCFKVHRRIPSPICAFGRASDNCCNRWIVGGKLCDVPTKEATTDGEVSIAQQFFLGEAVSQVRVKFIEADAIAFSGAVAIVCEICQAFGNRVSQYRRNGIVVLKLVGHFGEEDVVGLAEFGGGASEFVCGFLFRISVMTFNPLVSDGVTRGGVVEPGPQVQVSSPFEFTVHCLNDVSRIGSHYDSAGFFERFEAQRGSNDFGTLICTFANEFSNGTAAALIVEYSGCRSSWVKLGLTVT
jgi:hypothetical protein